MKISNVDSFIEEFRNGRDIWSRATIELAVREIEKQRKRIAEIKSLLLWALNNINIPFYLFSAEDERNVWRGKVVDIFKEVKE